MYMPCSLYVCVRSCAQGDLERKEQARERVPEAAPHPLLGYQIARYMAYFYPLSQ
jgi:hypothetical protein